MVYFSFGSDLRLAGCLLAMCLLLAGCKTTPEPFESTELVDDDKSFVYVYWPGQTWREKAGQHPEIQVDGVPVGLLKYKTYIPLELSPGSHEFRATGDSEFSDWQGRDKVVVLPIEAGEITYLRFMVKYDQQKNVWRNPGMSYVVQLLPISEKKARMEMGDLKEAKQKN